MHSERLKWTFLPKAYPLGDVTDFSSFPSRHIFSIHIGISLLLSLEPLFCDWPISAWIPSLPCSMTDSLSVLIGTLYLTTRYSSEDWVPWTYCDSAHFNLPTICSLDLLKFVNRSLEVNHPSSNSESSSWSNMTFILQFLDVNRLIHTSGYAAVILNTVENMSSNTTWYCGEIEPFNKFITNSTCV